MTIIIAMIINLIINLLNQKAQKVSIKELLPIGLHSSQGGGIGVCQKTKKVLQKNGGHKHAPFFLSGDQM